MTNGAGITRKTIDNKKPAVAGSSGLFLLFYMDACLDRQFSQAVTVFLLFLLALITGRFPPLKLNDQGAS